ncbi:MAG TPA: HypC/HybG/HupF family hydrogenase formation chaperone [Pseudonocardia sp.]|jgi:hydrogenase expression/formation protein HypC
MNPATTHEVCLTCSDEAVPALILELRELDLALARLEPGECTGPETETEISVALVDVRVGDVVLVHAKEAIAVVTGQVGTEVAERP